MAAVPGAYGLRPVNMLGGRGMTSAFNQFEIVSAYNAICELLARQSGCK